MSGIKTIGDSDVNTTPEKKEYLKQAITKMEEQDASSPFSALGRPERRRVLDAARTVMNNIATEISRSRRLRLPPASDEVVMSYARHLPAKVRLHIRDEYLPRLRETFDVGDQLGGNRLRMRYASELSNMLITERFDPAPREDPAELARQVGPR